MTWLLTDEERLLRDTARDFALREVAPTAIERDEAERFDRSIFRQMGNLGLTGAPLPESVGGAVFSYLGWTLIMEELGAADMATAVTLSVHILSQYPVVTWGSDGFGFGAHEKKMGIRSCPAAELVFDGCVVPVANRLGDEGEGYKIALSALAEGRISIAAACVGLARSALERAVAEGVHLLVQALADP